MFPRTSVFSVRKVVFSFNRVMTGDDLIDSEAAEEEERFWRSMYYRLVHKFNELKLN